MLKSQKKEIPSQVVDVSGLVRLHGQSRYESPDYAVLKRGMDILIAGIALLIFFPVFFVLGAIVFISDPGPVLYKQRRVGRGGQEFWMYKFRSMRQNADVLLKELLENDAEARAEFEATYKLKNDPRLIRFGSVMRKLSLDELPQLINVILGDMSLVGPRPIVAPEAIKYGDVFEIYKRMKPGCAGLWQCSGRNDTTYDERVELDRRYYFEASVRRDFWVLWKTLLSMVRLKGAY